MTRGRGAVDQQTTRQAPLVIKKRRQLPLSATAVSGQCQSSDQTLQPHPWRRAKLRAALMGCCGTATLGRQIYLVRLMAAVVATVVGLFAVSVGALMVVATAAAGVAVAVVLPEPQSSLRALYWRRQLQWLTNPVVARREGEKSNCGKPEVVASLDRLLRDAALPRQCFC